MKTCFSDKELIIEWVKAFNDGNVDKIVSFYHDSAINHQVAESPIEGKGNIRQMLEREFANAEMKCTIDNLFEDVDWVILEWKDPLGLRGCGFFRFMDEKIIFQRDIGLN
jgi:hypothetical protein